MLEATGKANCARAGAETARALDGAAALLEGRWTLQIVDRLIDGPLRFSVLLARVGGISAKVLASRLERMIADGLVDRTMLGDPHGVQVYALTAEGLKLRPVVCALVDWHQAHRAD